LLSQNHYSKQSRFLNNKTPPHISTLAILAGISAMNMSIFLPSLPSMARDFDVSYGTIQIFISGYFLALAFFQLLTGPISDRIGRRTTMIIAFSIFTVSTIMCEITSNFYTFLFFRVLQASVAAGFVIGRAIIRDIVPMEHAASMIGYVTMAMTIMPMLGPAIGGLIEEHSHWQLSFRLMYVLGGIALLLIFFDQSETIKEKQTSLFSQARSYLKLFKNKQFWYYSFILGFSTACYFCFLTGAPIISETYFKISPSKQGYLFAIPGIGFLIGNYLTGRYTLILGTYRLMFWGCLIALMGPFTQFLMLSIFDLGAVSLFGPMFFVGLGQGLTLPNAAAGVVSVNPKLAGSASGLGSTIQITIGGILAFLTGYFISITNSPLQLVIIFLGCLTAALVFTFMVKKGSNIK
jgi:DHA1 family bicyclomycin/chloramphenicol resistance-like MFS transporter